jgi:hypothetical protein
MRLGSRPNEGYAEMSICVYPAGGKVGFMFQRPNNANNHAHDAGELKFEIIKPFEHQRITYSGRVCMPKPLERSDLATALEKNPYSKCNLEIDYLDPSVGAPSCVSKRSEVGNR